MGLTRTTFSLPSIPLASTALLRLSFHVQPNFFASESTTRKPTLWRVCSYFMPGLPSPITNFITLYPITRCSNLFWRCLASIGKPNRQVLWQARLKNLFLCLVKVIWNAVELETTLTIIYHKGRSCVAIAGLPNTARVD